MKVLVLAFHPNMEQSVVNRAFADTLKGAPGITLRDLYQEYPDEAIDVEKEQKLCEEHDRIVFQFPLYWYRLAASPKKMAGPRSSLRLGIRNKRHSASRQRIHGRCIGGRSRRSLSGRRVKSLCDQRTVTPFSGDKQLHRYYIPSALRLLSSGHGRKKRALLKVRHNTGSMC